jgi:hypothetical protein
MFMPVMLGLVYTRTPWWSAVAAFAAGVVAVIGVGYWAAVSQGLDVTFLSSIFGDIQMTAFGMRMGRFEVNMIVGTIVSTAVFFATSFATTREGAFRERIEAFERDLATPAHADPGAALDLRGLRAFRLAGRMSVGVGVLLMSMTLVTLDHRGVLNLIAGVLALALGVLIESGTRRVERRLAAQTLPA